jgi:hypothetical protein
MDCEFIHSIETWGSGGHMMDILVLKDARVLVIAEHGIFVYRDRAAFDSGQQGAPIEVALQPLTAGMRR